MRMSAPDFSKIYLIQYIYKVKEIESNKEIPKTLERSERSRNPSPVFILPAQITVVEALNVVPSAILFGAARSSYPQAPAARTSLFRGRPGFFPQLLVVGVEDPESCRDQCHAWYLMSTCVRPLGSGSRDPSPPLYVHLGNLNHLCTEPLSSLSTRPLRPPWDSPLPSGLQSERIGRSSCSVKPIPVEREEDG
ncbi:hypothetical protein KM043_008324 [Ampulex compressa]|nr:hypothetical protein KM043_008324 [Ampulex compressa]